MPVNRNLLLAAAAAGIAIGLTPSARAARPCPPDLNCNGAVTVTDLVSLITMWAQSGSPADLNGDGTVNVTDLLALIDAWGPCLFAYPAPFRNEEAHQIGLEMLGSTALLLTPARYNRVERDLALIRAFQPDLTAEPHSPIWVPNQIIVALAGAPTPDYLCANTYYQATPEVLFGTIYVLTFPGWVNVDAMVTLYSAIDGVDFAEPNGMVGGQNFWTPDDLPGGLWRWSIDDGFHDCFDTCDCHRYFVIDITVAGQVSLVSCERTGFRWCDFTGIDCPQ